MILDVEKYNEVLAAMRKRALRSKIATFSFAYILLLSLFCVPALYITFKADNAKKNRELTSLILSVQQNNSAIDIINNLRQATEEITKASKNISSSTDLKSPIQRSGLGLNSTYLNTKSTFEKAIEAAAPYFLLLSGILFVGYILKLFIVFIKYNMQMTNDYENQTISLLLSQGSTDEFSKLIQTLREHNISFEKTPNLPQEKIISELIELIRASKNKS